jgi:ubiquinol-cytochrome c reductase cytochrome b subunit
MSSDHSTYQPTSGFGKWIDSRLPLPRMVHDSFVSYPVPRNLNYAYTFGGILMVMLVSQILTGIVLAMHYAADTAIAFQSVEKIMRDVNSGWLLRYMHANGASFFFVAVYLHIFRGMYYGSYKAPREVLWILGVVIYLLMMATAFMGYVLPWGQMSFWGATVITGFFTAFPGRRRADPAVAAGRLCVDNPTLNRFFSLHYLLPFMIFGVVILHVWALHMTGQTNPTGVEVKSKTDTVPFTPYATVKDAFAMSMFFIVFAYFIFFMPNYLGHADNYIGQSAEDAGAHRAGMVLPAVLRDPACHHLQHRPDRLQAWRRAGHVRFDRGAVRAALARHVEGALGGLPALVQAVLLDLCGQRHLPGLARREACGRRLHDAGADRTLYYFAFFLVILPVLGLIETPKRLPNSITEAVLAKKAGNGGAAAAAAASPETRG